MFSYMFVLSIQYECEMIFTLELSKSLDSPKQKCCLHGVITPPHSIQVEDNLFLNCIFISIFPLIMRRQLPEFQERTETSMQVLYVVLTWMDISPLVVGVFVCFKQLC